MEIAKDEDKNPIKQDIKNNELRYVDDRILFRYFFAWFLFLFT